ncbi:MAG: leucine-rich repeat protein [Clostridia bacterium]|nr:leucine-rich repeat protein [Clostridia bacterium]
MKKYRVILYFVVILAVITAAAIASATVTSGTFTDDNGKTFSYSYNAATGNIHIGGSGAINLYVSDNPDALPWHQYRSEIKSITVSDGIIQLGRGMFEGCTSLEQINLPGSVLYIQPEVFADCTALTSAEFGDGLLTLADRVFAGCSNLQTLTLPDTVVGLGSEVISGTGIKELKLGTNISALLPKKAGADGSTFKGADSELKVYAFQLSYAAQWLADSNLNTDNVNYTVEKINGTIADYTGVENSIKWEIDIETRTASIYDIAGVGTAQMPDYEEAKQTPWFAYSDKYDTVVISEGITRVGSRTFQSDSSTQKVYLPTTVTSYGTYLFNATSALTDIVFAEGTTNLDFQLVINNNNASLKQLTIPKSVTKIHSNFFRDADNKERVTELTLNVYADTAGYEWALIQQGKNDVIKINILR